MTRLVHFECLTPTLTLKISDESSYRRITFFLRHTSLVREVFHTLVMHILTENIISVRFINTNWTVAVVPPDSGSGPLASYICVGIVHL